MDVADFWWMWLTVWVDVADGFGGVADCFGGTADLWWVWLTDLVEWLTDLVMWLTVWVDVADCFGGVAD